jgi:hypothetical protein
MNVLLRRYPIDESHFSMLLAYLNPEFYAQLDQSHFADVSRAVGAMVNVTVYKIFLRND